MKKKKQEKTLDSQFCRSIWGLKNVAYSSGREETELTLCCRLVSFYERGGEIHAVIEHHVKRLGRTLGDK